MFTLKIGVIKVFTFFLGISRVISMIKTIKTTSNVKFNDCYLSKMENALKLQDRTKHVNLHIYTFLMYLHDRLDIFVQLSFCTQTRRA